MLNVSAYCSSEASIVVLLEISALVRQVGTSIRPLFVEASGIMEPVFASLLHPVSATRVAAAWCLRYLLLFNCVVALSWLFLNANYKIY